MLVTLNVMPLIVYFLFLAALVERLGESDWGRVFVMAAAVFGTFLTTFAVVLNNHLPGAVCALVALYACVRIWFDGERRWRYFAVAGLFAGLLVADELPGASLAAALGLALLWKAPRPTLLGFAARGGAGGGGLLRHQLDRPSQPPPALHAPRRRRTTGITTPTSRTAGRSKATGSIPKGIDLGEPSPAVYAMHALVGHHGIFSLTPVWLLSASGTLLWLVQKRDRRLRELALLIGGNQRRLHGVLYRAADGGPQLRRHDQRFSLGVLACAAVACGHASGGRLDGPAPLDARRWPWRCCWSPSSRSAIRRGIRGRRPG